MTTTTSPSQARREGNDKFIMPWKTYLEHVVQIDPDNGYECVCFFLDEEGNYVLEMTPEEARTFAYMINLATTDLERLIRVRTNGASSGKNDK